MERHNCFIRQALDETLSQYATALHNLSATCEFGNLREDLVKDIFVCGLSPNFKNIKERLLSEGEIKWQKAFEIARSIEMARENAAATQTTTTTSDEMIAAIKSRGKEGKRTTEPFQQQKKQTSGDRCKKCGQVHRVKCPAEGAICHICKKPNHFAKMCFTTNNKQTEQRRKKKFVKNITEERTGIEEDELYNDLFVGLLQETKPKETMKEWNVDVDINGFKVNCQIDTGAQANLMSVKMLKKLDVCKINKKVLNNIVTFSGEKLPVVGCADLKVRFDDATYFAKFYILNMDCKSVMGLDLAVKMNLVQIVKSIKCKDILEKYVGVFNGLGQLQNKSHLQLKESSQ
ncbi:PREDICTED: uncharacterized protein LOC108367524 [Rhagoletis zephyria]|uniref:uncharacterized protein LOC108367524 n=1 Tax=Rhagoletis zephyria TaxID=28612 RepID=UPI000811430B|nr:PREDICTED: uncharacterized protein LOC108367524 [Rhagoletis zephyria]XP_036340591.1 uncharacterized protein LOC118749941 [Rhagoletis pomonella]